MRGSSLATDKHTFMNKLTDALLLLALECGAMSASKWIKRKQDSQSQCQGCSRLATHSEEEEPHLQPSEQSKAGYDKAWQEASSPQS